MTEGDIINRVIENPKGYDVRVPVRDYAHLIERGNVHGLAWLHVDHVSVGDASTHPVKAEGGQWKWSEVFGIREHVERQAETTILRAATPNPKDWEALSEHDPGAADAIRATGPTYSNTDDMLDKLRAAGWILVQINKGS